MLFDQVNPVLQTYTKEIIKDRQNDLSARMCIISLSVKVLILKVM